jgi:hypothetical protein
MVILWLQSWHITITLRQALKKVRRQERPLGGDRLEQLVSGAWHAVQSLWQEDEQAQNIGRQFGFQTMSDALVDPHTLVGIEQFGPPLLSPLV